MSSLNYQSDQHYCPLLPWTYFFSFDDIVRSWMELLLATILALLSACLIVPFHISNSINRRII